MAAPTEKGHVTLSCGTPYAVPFLLTDRHGVLLRRRGILPDGLDVCPGRPIQPYLRADFAARFLLLVSAPLPGEPLPVLLRFRGCRDGYPAYAMAFSLAGEEPCVGIWFFPALRETVPVLLEDALILRLLRDYLVQTFLGMCRRRAYPDTALYLSQTASLMREFWMEANHTRTHEDAPDVVLGISLLQAGIRSVLRQRDRLCAEVPPVLPPDCRPGQRLPGYSRLLALCLGLTDLILCVSGDPDAPPPISFQPCFRQDQIRLLWRVAVSSPKQRCAVLGETINRYRFLTGNAWQLQSSRAGSCLTLRCTIPLFRPGRYPLGGCDRFDAGDRIPAYLTLMNLLTPLSDDWLTDPTEPADTRDAASRMKFQ